MPTSTSSRGTRSTPAWTSSSMRASVSSHDVRPSARNGLRLAASKTPPRPCAERSRTSWPTRNPTRGSSAPTEKTPNPTAPFMPVPYPFLEASPSPGDLRRAALKRTSPPSDDVRGGMSDPAPIAPEPRPDISLVSSGSAEPYRRLADIFHDVLSEQSLGALLERIADALAVLIPYEDVHIYEA